MNRRYLGAVAGAVLGAIVGATVGGLVGRLIALVGDETVSAVVPMAVCAVLGYIFGAASGAKGSLDRIGAKRSMAGAIVAGILLFVSAGVAGYFGSDNVGAFLAYLIGGLVLAALAAAAVAGSGRQVAPVAAAADVRAPKLEVTRQTVAAPAPPRETQTETEAETASEALAFLEAEAEADAAALAPAEATEATEPPASPRPARRAAKKAVAAKKPPAPTAPEKTPLARKAPPGTRPRRTRPLRAGDVSPDEE